MSRSELALTACMVASALLLAGGVGDLQPPAAAWFGLTGLAAYSWWCCKASDAWATVRARMLAVAIVIGACAAFAPQQGLAALIVPALLAALRLGLAFAPPVATLLDRHLVWSYLFALASVAYRQEPYCRAWADETCRSAGDLLAAFLAQAWAPA